jgi:hypothetical protein
VGGDGVGTVAALGLGDDGEDGGGHTVARGGGRDML